MSLTFDEKLEAFKTLIKAVPTALETYLLLYIQFRNIASGANTMDAQSGLTLIGEPGAGRLGLHPGGAQFTDRDGNFTEKTAGEGKPSQGDPDEEERRHPSKTPPGRGF